LHSQRSPASAPFSNSLTASTSNNQVLAPTWNLKTEQKQDFFVNAIEGQVMELGEKENQVVDEHTLLEVDAVRVA
jgi:hypothetical protein